MYYILLTPYDKYKIINLVKYTYTYVCDWIRKIEV